MWHVSKAAAQLEEDGLHDPVDALAQAGLSDFTLRLFYSIFQTPSAACETEATVPCKNQKIHLVLAQ